MKRMLIASAVCLGLVATVSAAEITQQLPFGWDTPNFSETLTFNKYNGVPGDLTAIKIEMFLETKGGYLVADNDAIDPAHVDVELGAEGEVTSTDVFIFPGVDTIAVSTASWDLGAENGDGPNNVDPTAPDGNQLIGQYQSDFTSVAVNPAFWAGYMGAGTFDVLADITQRLDFGSVSGVEGSYGPVQAGGYVKVVYEYVPEPASLSLLGLGALYLLRRR